MNIRLWNPKTERFEDTLTPEPQSPFRFSGMTVVMLSGHNVYLAKPDETKHCVNTINKTLFNGKPTQ